MTARKREGASAIIMDGRGKFLLQRRDNIAGIICPGMIGLFGGHREGGESFIQCIVREIREELSYPLEPPMLELLKVYDGQNLDAPGETIEAHVFLISALSAEAVTVTEGALAIMTPTDVLLAVDSLTPMTAFALRTYLNSGKG